MDHHRNSVVWVPWQVPVFAHVLLLPVYVLALVAYVIYKAIIEPIQGGSHG